MCDERLKILNSQVDDMKSELTELNDQIVELIAERNETESKLEIAEDKLADIEERHSAEIEKYVHALNTLRDALIDNNLGYIGGKPVSRTPCRWRHCTEILLILDHSPYNWCEYCEDAHCEHHVEKCTMRHERRINNSLRSDSGRCIRPKTPEP